MFAIKNTKPNAEAIKLPEDTGHRLLINTEATTTASTRNADWYSTFAQAPLEWAGISASTRER
jgi:hypothetical protein